MTLTRFAAPALAGLLLAVPAAAQAPAPLTDDPGQVRPGAYRLDPAHGKITWSVNHLGFSTYYGQIPEVAATLELDTREPTRSRLSATIGTGSIDALHARLNEHLRGADFLDAARFPAATFASTGIERTGPTTARVTGDLTLRGVTRPVAFDATFNQAGTHPVDKTYTIGFDGRTVVRRSEFGITAFLPALGDEVTLRLEGEFKAVEQSSPE
jgi:polyisoprenoid-binding protein YceI